MMLLDGWQYGDIGYWGIEFWGHPLTRITRELYARLGKPDLDTLRKLVEEKLRGLNAQAPKDDAWLVELPDGVWLVANEAEGWTCAAAEER